jgi:hypothetical protein
MGSSSAEQAGLLTEKYNNLCSDIKVLDWDALTEKHNLKFILGDGEFADLNVEMETAAEVVRLAKVAKLALLQKLTIELGVFVVNQEGHFVQRGLPLFPGNKVIKGTVLYNEQEGWEFAVRVVPRWVGPHR